MAVLLLIYILAWHMALPWVFYLWWSVAFIIAMSKAVPKQVVKK